MSEQVKAGEQKVEQKNEFLGAMDDCGERAEYHNLVDILFVIDATGSMSWCISQMKKTVCKIMKKFSDKQYNIKFAIELYRDHPPQEYSYIEKHFDLRNQDDIIKVIDDECEVAGGGDTPEAVFDGLINGLKKTKWRVSSDGKTKSKRFLFHGADAPPHGKQYGCTSSDPKWTQNGAPSGYTRMQVKQLLEQYNVDYSLIKCGNQVDIMAGLFKECFGVRFKRQLQIKQESYSSKAYGGAKGAYRLERKRSVEYMRDIQMQERGGSGSQYEQDECQDADEGSVHSGIQKCAQDQPRLRVDQLDRDIECKAMKAPSPKKTSLFEGIRSFFSGPSEKSKPAPKAMLQSMPMEKEKVEHKKKKKKVLKKKAEKAVQQKKDMKMKGEDAYDNSSDEEKGGKPRSMASLVLSDIEDGIDRHFDVDEPEKKQKKVTKDI